MDGMAGRAVHNVLRRRLVLRAAVPDDTHPETLRVSLGHPETSETRPVRGTGVRRRVFLLLRVPRLRSSLPSSLPPQLTSSNLLVRNVAIPHLVVQHRALLARVPALADDTFDQAVLPHATVVLDPTTHRPLAPAGEAAQGLYGVGRPSLGHDMACGLELCG